MKRFGGLEVTMAALFCAGAYACAAPEDLPPEVVDAAEKYYFAASATGQTPPTPPGSTAVTPTPPGSTAVTPTPPATTAVTPTPPATTAVTPGVPPVAPPSATVPPATPPFATPPAILPEAEALEPADAVPLDEWLNQ